MKVRVSEENTYRKLSDFNEGEVVCLKDVAVVFIIVSTASTVGIKGIVLSDSNDSIYLHHYPFNTEVREVEIDSVAVHYVGG